MQTDYECKFGDQSDSHVLDKGINHVYIRPRRLEPKGNIELNLWIEEQDFYRMLAGAIINEMRLFHKKLGK
jgi:hypothetical protein